MANLDYVTVVDDDDYVSARYLEVLLSIADKEAIGLAQLADVVDDPWSPSNFDTYVNRGTLAFAGRRVPTREVHTAVSFDVAKIVPTSMAQSVSYDTGLRSGHDIVYWTFLANLHRPELHVAEPSDGATYYRRLRKGSHSRPAAANFEFSVEQRLDVIERLLKITADSAQYMNAAAQQLVRAQISHMNLYLKDRPEDYARVIGEIESRRLVSFPYELLAADAARDLVITSAF